MAARRPALATDSLIALALLLAPAAIAQAPGVIVSDQGVAGVTAETPYSAEAISKALGGWPVKKATAHSDGVPLPVLEATHDGKRALWVMESKEKGRIGRIFIFDLRAATQAGAMLGTTWADTYAKASEPGCAAGVGADAGTVVCHAPQLRHVTFIFKGPSSAQANTVPPPEVLGSWPMVTMIWSAEP